MAYVEITNAQLAAVCEHEIRQMYVIMSPGCDTREKLGRTYELLTTLRALEYDIANVMKEMDAEKVRADVEASTKNEYDI